MKRKGQKKFEARGVRPQITPQIARRRVILVVAGTIVAGLILATLAIWSSLPQKLGESDRAMLKLYENVGVALASDDLSAAQRAATTLHASFPRTGVISEAAVAMQKSDSLESARYAFKAMSAEAVQLVKGHSDFYVMTCPMGRCLAKCDPCENEC